MRRLSVFVLVGLVASSIVFASVGVRPDTARASGGHRCGNEVFGRPGFGAKASGIRALHTTCALARQVPRHSLRHNGSAKLYYSWHRFRCHGVSRTPPHGLGYLRYYCHRSSQRVRFKLVIP